MPLETSNWYKSMKAEVYRYLDMVPDLDLALDQQINQLMQEVMTFPGKYTYKIFPLAKSPLRIEGFRPFESQSLARLLGGANQVVVFAGTLGTAFDRALHRHSYVSPTSAMIFSACGSAWIEKVIDEMVETIQKQEDSYMTPRYSPGYGDLNLDFQGDILRLVAADKIGITVNSQHLMTPVKSITGIIGLSDQPLQTLYHICDDCLRRTQCDKTICRREDEF